MNLPFHAVPAVILTTVITFQPAAQAANAPDHSWVRQIGNAERNLTAELAVAPDGATTLIDDHYDAISLGTINVPEPNPDNHEDRTLIIGNGPDGATRWAYSFGSRTDDDGTSTAFDSQGNTIATGHFFGTVTAGGVETTALFRDAFLIKVSPTGKVLWFNAIGGDDNQNGYQVAVDSDDNILLVGVMEDEGTFAGEPLTNADNWRDGFVAKYNPAGRMLWVRQFESNGSFTLNEVDTDARGNVYVAGNMLGTVSIGAGSMTSTTRAVYLAKLSPQGEPRWSRIATGPSNTQSAFDLKATPAGEVYVCGRMGGQCTFGSITTLGNATFNGFIAKADTGGNFLWAQAIQSASSSAIGALAIDNAGDLLSAGQFARQAIIGNQLINSSLSSTDAFAARFDPDGTMQWLKRTGAGGTEFSSGIGADSARNVIWAGAFDDTVQLGSTSLTSAGNYDIFLTKLASGDADSAAPTIHRSPQSTGSPAGGSMLLTVNASGPPPLSY